jgi:hypothetical protein
MATVLNRRLWNSRTLASSWRSSHFTQTHDHQRVSPDGADPLHEACFVYDNTSAEPLDTYKNARTYSLNPGFKL